MAIPEGYRLLTVEDIGKTFGVDLESTVYFDTDVTDPYMPYFTSSVTSYTYTNFLVAREEYSEPYGGDIAFVYCNNIMVYQPYAFFVESVNLNGVQITSFSTDVDWNNFLYVKDISEDPKGIISKSKITPIFDKAREKTGTTDKYTLDDIPQIMDELEKISVWEGTREESNTDNLDITENNYNVLTNKNKITFNTAQQKLTDLLNVYFTIEVSSTEEMNAFLQESTAGRVFKYVGTTGTYTNGSYYKVNDNNEYEEVVVLNLQEKTATPTKSEQEITPDSTYNGLGKVVVKPIPSNYIEPSGTIELTTLGEHDVTQYAKANVNVPASAFEDSIYEELNEMTFGESASYTLTLNCESYVLNSEYYAYSLGSGTAWNQFTSSTMTLENVRTIKFRSTISGSAYYLVIGTTSGGNDIYSGYESDDITITEDTTWYVGRKMAAQGGGGTDE